MVRDLLMMKVQIALGKAKPKDEQFVEILEYFVGLQKPQIFDPYDETNIIRKIEKEFEETLNTMEDQSHFNPKNLTEYSYYHKIVFLQQKFKPDASK